MDYSTGTELWKYQWDFIHDPEGGWHIFEDVEEGELVDVGDTLIISITNIENSQLAPPAEYNLTIEFSTENYKELQEKYPDQTNFIIISVYDNDNNIVYSQEINTNENAGSFSWNGIYENEEGEIDTIKIENGPYKLYIEGYCGEDPSVIEELSCDNLGDYTCFIRNLIFNPENTFESFKSTFGNSVLFISDQDSVEIGLKEAWAEWTAFEYIEDYPLCSRSEYFEIRDLYLERMNEIGVDTSVVDPIEYLNTHLVSGEFLEMDIPLINIRFLYFLRKLEKELGRGENGGNQYQQICQELQQNESEISSYARMSTVGSGNDETLSDHGLGYAIDIDAEKNIYVGEGRLAAYIEFLTNIDLVNNDLTIEKSKIAHDRFMYRKANSESEFKSIFTSELIQQYIYLKNLDEDTITSYLEALCNQMQNETQNIINSLEAGEDLDSLQENFRVSLNQYLGQLFGQLDEFDIVENKIDSINDVLYLYEALEEAGEMNALESYFSENRSTILNIIDLIDYQKTELDSGIPEQWRNILIFFNSDLRDITFQDYSANMHFLETKMNDKFNLIMHDNSIQFFEMNAADITSVMSSLIFLVKLLSLKKLP